MKKYKITMTKEFYIKAGNEDEAQVQAILFPC